MSAATANATHSLTDRKSSCNINGNVALDLSSTVPDDLARPRDTSKGVDSADNGKFIAGELGSEWRRRDTSKAADSTDNGKFITGESGSRRRVAPGTAMFRVRTSGATSVSPAIPLQANNHAGSSGNRLVITPSTEPAIVQSLDSIASRPPNPSMWKVKNQTVAERSHVLASRDYIDLRESFLICHLKGRPSYDGASTGQVYRDKRTTTSDINGRPTLAEILSANGSYSATLSRDETINTEIPAPILAYSLRIINSLDRNNGYIEKPDDEQDLTSPTVLRVSPQMGFMVYMTLTILFALESLECA